VCAADGNPNEENVGAFGVGNRTPLIMLVDSHRRTAGFYSVFSVTEEPLVTSGGIPQLLAVAQTYPDYVF
jgi:hypothetical protein